MTFVSYAQNYEDVMLYRALKGVERGFYIDVGAMDPIVDSVTKAGGASTSSRFVNGTRSWCWIAPRTPI
jgi:hypothetical protein